MAPAGCRCCCRCCWGDVAAAARRGLVLLPLLLAVLPSGPGALATEHYTPLSLLKQELQHRQQEAPAGGGCSPQSGDWGDQFSAECGGEWAAARGASGSPGGWRGRGGCGPGRPGLSAAGRGVCSCASRLHAVSRRGRFLPPAPSPPRALLPAAAPGGR